MDLLGTSQIAQLLGVSYLRVWLYRKRPAFPSPARREGRREYFEPDAIWRWAAGEGRRLAARAPTLYRPVDAGYPAGYKQAEVIDGYVLLWWDTALGSVCVAYPVGDSVDPDLQHLAQAVPRADIAVLVLDTWDAAGPELAAVDRIAPDRRYGLDWPELARAIGGPAPWWPPALRSPADMLRWRPGIEPTLIKPIPGTDVMPLLALAHDEPADSSIALAMHHMVGRIQAQADESARSALTMLEEHTWPEHRAAITLAAKPQIPTHPDHDVPETILRDGWNRILARTDTLAEDGVRIADEWDGGEYFPFSAFTEVTPRAGTAAGEWAATLTPSSRTAAHAAVGRSSIQHTHQDPATGLPAITDEKGVLYAAVPQRLPATAPLAQVILQDATVWIRTADGRLYLAPRYPGNGINWGYRGSGPHALAGLLNLLLDDINAAAPSTLDTHILPGLLGLAMTKWPSGTVLSRDDLIAARDHIND
ncbi:hypothetical protein SAMN05216276_108621 [Streptosporangium subroseum]|uniref:Uncharacterized protein n=1 Tax=Streptosporangium subroseum TaxID=106412 RepID=A0A239P5P6_9ACTN|nr:hypothetical protein [Streptosporangium subroseum]SNT61928.1 hypothetical protein SAMN05216276_108621 [Streptosporangium subroseum]